LGVIAIADGLGSAIARQCGGNSAQAPGACAAALRIIAIISAIAVIPLLALGLMVPAQHALIFVAIAFPFALYVQTMNSFYLIALRVERTNIASLVINAGAAAAMLVATILIRPPIDIIMSIWTAGYIAGAAIVYQGLERTSLDREVVQALFTSQVRFAARSSSASLLTFLASRVDVFIVAGTLSATALGNYTLALACGELMWQIGRAISWPAYGRVATATFAGGAELTAKITRIVLALEVLVAVSAFVAGPAVLTLVYGAAFADAGPVLRILVPGMALYAADSILTYFISVKIGRPGTILKVEAITLIVCAIGSLATVGRFGMTGPAVATTLAYLISFAVKSALFGRATGIKPAKLLVLRLADLRTPKVTSAEAVTSAVA
jgi:O-antigen/teichoic acid export membrane protein